MYLMFESGGEEAECRVQDSDEFDYYVIRITIKAGCLPRGNGEEA